jgi:hypothetical protein
MSATLDVNCPKCKKAFKVPAEFVGRTIRCKSCQTPFEVTAPAGPKAAKPVKPASAKPAPPPPAPAANAPIPFKKDDDEEEDFVPGQSANPYGVQKDDLDVPRCPFCAKELDPPDTQICLNCGYDMLARKRHGSKKTYALTTGDYIKHWLPGILCLCLIMCLITWDIGCWMKQTEVAKGMWLDTDEKNPITGQPMWYVKPWCCPLWTTLVFIYIIWRAGKVVIRRLIVQWKPEETVKKDD